jgi:hypothetical protein
MQTLSVLDSRALLQHAHGIEKSGASLPLDLDLG